MASLFSKLNTLVKSTIRSNRPTAADKPTPLEEAAPAAEQSFGEARRSLDDAAADTAVPSDASERVQKSAAQAKGLIEQARTMLDEKSAALDMKSDETAETIENTVDDGSEDAADQIDDVKRRLS